MIRDKSNPSNGTQRNSDATIADMIAAIDAGKPIRQDFDDGGRLHIDRPLPFLCVHIGKEPDSAARHVASANASYLIMPQIDAMVPIIKAVGAAMTERFSHFILLDLGELERDQLPSADAPYLPPFEIIVSATSVFFLMNGKPLERDGKYAAFRRVPAKGEVRSNIHVQGTAETVTVTDKILLIAETVRPKLVQDGMFLVGLDIVGDKILEINVFTPGGLWSMSQMYKTDFMESVIIALENKLTIRASYPNSVPNRELATL